MTAKINGQVTRVLTSRLSEMMVGNVEPKHCMYEGCYSATRGAKDYCTKHVLHNTYAKRIVEELAARAREDRDVQRQGAKVVNVDGITAEEILLELRQAGHRTIERMTRELNMPRQLIYNYAIALRKVGKIQFYSSSRGALVLCLASEMRAQDSATVCA